MNTTEEKQELELPDDENNLAQVIEPIIKNNDWDPEKKTQEVVRIVKQDYSFSGPIPPPQILKGYNELVPDAAERILKMAEKQAEHRMEMEKKIIPNQQCQSMRGQILGFIITILLIGVAVYAIYKDAYMIAGIIVGVTILMVVGKFVGQGRMRRDLRDKQPDEPED